METQCVSVSVAMGEEGGHDLCMRVKNLLPVSYYPVLPFFFFLNLIPFAGGMRAFMFFFGREMEGGGSAFW